MHTSAQEYAYYIVHIYYTKDNHMHVYLPKYIYTHYTIIQIIEIMPGQLSV